MAPRVPKIVCTSCRNRHRSCQRTRGSSKCTECRRRNIDCDIQQKTAAAMHGNARPQQSRAQPTSDSPLSLNSQQTLPAVPVNDHQRDQLLSGESVFAIGLDFGTNYSSARCAIASGTHGVQPGSSNQGFVVSFSGHSEAMMEAAVVFDPHSGQHQLRVGKDVQNLLKTNRLQREDVFSVPKLSLLAGNERILGRRGGGIPSVDQAHRHADDVKRLHRRALASVRGKEVHVPLRFDHSTYRIAAVNSVLDILEGIAAWLLDRIIVDIRERKGYSTNDMKQILPRSRVAAAVPEIWADSMVDEFQKILIKVGFPNVHIVSEPKCASVVIADEVLADIRGAGHSPEQLEAALEEAKKTITIVYDLGAGTLDLATTQIEAIEPKLKIKSIVKGTGSLWGSTQINEIFKKRWIRYLIGNPYDMVVTQLSQSWNNGFGSEDLSDDQRYKEDLLIEPFARGFEETKRDFDHNDPQDLVVSFRSARRLPPFPGVPALQDGVLSLSHDSMIGILQEYVEGMHEPVKNQKKQLLENGLWPPGTKVELRCVGGGSKSEYLRHRLQMFEPTMAVLNHATHDGGLVSKGAMMMACDPELGHYDFARTAYGTAYTVDYDPSVHIGVEVVPATELYPYPQVENRVHWGIKVGQNTREPPEPMVVRGEIEWAEADLNWPIDAEMVLWKTEDEGVGNTDDIDVNTPGIQYAGSLSMDIQQHEHAFQMQETADGTRFLRIQTRAIAMREGMRFFWILVIHKTGKFPNENLTEFNDQDYLHKRLELDAVLQYGALKVESA